MPKRLDALDSRIPPHSILAARLADHGGGYGAADAGNASLLSTQPAASGESANAAEFDDLLQQLLDAPVLEESNLEINALLLDVVGGGGLEIGAMKRASTAANIFAQTADASTAADDSPPTAVPEAELLRADKCLRVMQKVLEAYPGITAYRGFRASSSPFAKLASADSAAMEQAPATFLAIFVRLAGLIGRSQLDALQPRLLETLAVFAHSPSRSVPSGLSSGRYGAIHSQLS